MDRTAEMTAFVRTVEDGGFTAAAQQLALTPSALSKLVTRLENRLGARLLHRTTRRLQMTPEGEAFFFRARAILLAMDEAEAEVTESTGSPRGVLRLHCGTAFGIHQLTAGIPAFQMLCPLVDLELTISDQIPDKEGAYDLVIRIGSLDESSMVARRICNLERVICAAPRYLERHGIPQTPDDLQHHNCLWTSSLPALRRWPFDTVEGIRVVPVSGNVVANNAETVRQLVLEGVGIARLVDVTVGEALKNGELVPLLREWCHVEPVPLHVMYPSSRNLSPKVRAMVDYLVSTYGHAPWRNQAAKALVNS